MLNLQRVAMFVAVVETGSFTSAATTLRQTKAVVSFNIRQLEEELGVSLLLRTTRRLALTQAGEVFYRRSVHLLKETEDIVNDVQFSHSGFSGELRITSTPEYGSIMIIPALVAFGQAHPKLSIRHVSSSYHADLISEHFDVAIRLGKLADSSYHAALIDNFSIIPVAAPKWIKNHPIDSLNTLGKAEWVIHTRLQSPLRWQVTGPEQQKIDFSITGPVRFSTDSASALMSFILEGCGVALLPEWLVRSALASGELQHLLPDYHFPLQGVYAVYPNTRHISAKVRALIDFLQRRSRDWATKN
ncbi:LysR family transcriptional regulator [Xenorhabdus sp. TS4]|uniref:LysR family transcriptional regulator n=1 Tax=Xenorhabdus sp. TS4 TaxID=1873483 RepID=UPI00165726AA|nr:LysR family transcriptional regulator [Xenorhabdus sp. TS4]MBC8949311.1 transcriptional regulator PtxR [Xenorhabdus sp. TS4]